MKSVIKSLLISGTSLLLTAGPAAHASLVERSDGIRFDSEVGAACGALLTAVHFEPFEGRLEVHDQPVLDSLATCFTSGPLAGVKVAVVGYGDVSLPFEVSLSLANERARAAMAGLIERGVPYWQLEPWSLAVGHDGTDQRVRFRVIDPNVAIDVRPVDPAGESGGNR